MTFGMLYVLENGQLTIARKRKRSLAKASLRSANGLRRPSSPLSINRTNTPATATSSKQRLCTVQNPEASSDGVARFIVKRQTVQ